MKRKPTTTPEVKAFLAALRRFVKRYPSERAAARALKVSHVSVHLWLKGEQNPSPMTIRALKPDLNK